jgi:hypothetical protein
MDGQTDRSNERVRMSQSFGVGFIDLLDASKHSQRASIITVPNTILRRPSAAHKPFAQRVAVGCSALLDEDYTCNDTAVISETNSNGQLKHSASKERSFCASPYDACHTPCASRSHARL